MRIGRGKEVFGENELHCPHHKSHMTRPGIE
jgi:hypothetical protein